MPASPRSYSTRVHPGHVISNLARNLLSLTHIKLCWFLIYFTLLLSNLTVQLCIYLFLMTLLITIVPPVILFINFNKGTFGRHRMSVVMWNHSPSHIIQHSYYFWIFIKYCILLCINCHHHIILFLLSCILKCNTSGFHLIYIHL